jgi:hypothetical protein
MYLPRLPPSRLAVSAGLALRRVMADLHFVLEPLESGCGRIESPGRIPWERSGRHGVRDAAPAPDRKRHRRDGSWRAPDAGQDRPVIPHNPSDKRTVGWRAVRFGT